MTDKRKDEMKLKLCPFCGSAPEFDEIYIEPDMEARAVQHAIGCSNSECIIYCLTDKFDRRSDAAKAWNTRAALSAPRDDVAEQIRIWLRAQANTEQEPKAKSAFVEAHNAALKIIRADLSPPVPDAVTVSREVKMLRKCIADAALCLLNPNIAIIDTVWMNEKTNITLYEHLVSFLDVDLTGDIDHDKKILASLDAVLAEGE